MDGVVAARTLKQIDFITLYSTAADVSLFSNANNDTLQSFSGFSNKNPSNPNIVTGIQLPNIDSASICKSFHINTQVVNDMNVDVEGTLSFLTNGSVIFASPIAVNSGDSIRFSSSFKGDTLGTNIQVRFEDVTCSGFSTPTYIQNERTLKFELDLDSIVVFDGKVIPKNQRHFMGNASISLPFEKSSDSLLAFISTGEIQANYQFLGYDGPFSIVWQLTDSLNFVHEDSLLMVASPIEFTKNTSIVNDSLLLQRGHLNVAYYMRPFPGFPVRTKPHYRLLGRHSITSKWNVSYVQGTLKSSAQINSSVYPGLQPNRSHLTDSLSLKSFRLTTTLDGVGFGSYRILDSLGFTSNNVNSSFKDSSTWDLGNSNSDLYNFTQHTINRTIPSDSGNTFGALLESVYGNVGIEIDTLVGLRFNESYSVKQRLESLIGFADGSIQFTAASELRINESGTLDSLIFSADSVGIRFKLTGSSLYERTSDMNFKISDSQGNLLVEEKASIRLDLEPWVSQTFVLEPDHLTGEKLQLLMVGDIRELEESSLSTKDYFHLSIIIDLYD